MIMNKKVTFEWLSVSEVAKLEDVSTTTIYNRIKDGIYETMEFERGAYKGILVKYAKINDK